MKIRESLQDGLIAGTINIFVILMGLTVLGSSLGQEWFRLASPAPGAWAPLVAVGLWAGARARRHAMEDSKLPGLLSATLAGLLSGLADGILVGGALWLVSSLIGQGVQVRQWLSQLSAEKVELLTLGREPLPAAALWLGVLTASGLLGALLGYSNAQFSWWDSGKRGVRQGWDGVTAGPRRIFRHPIARAIIVAVLLAFLVYIPTRLSQYHNYTLGTVGIYAMLGLGLNIVVGLAGLLDLGYVAFFAIGAYTVGLLTAPEPHGIQISFWLAMPIAVVVAGMSGVLLGIPVLRMRGDYLAIVTLGFGEIIRILAKSDALTSFSGGPRGVRDIGGPVWFGQDLNSEFFFLYLILAGIALVAFVTYRLQHSRVGRAWMAMREDEDVAEAMGVYTLRYKLLAFAIGAAFAGLGGAMYASRNQFVGPEDFTLMVSINVLCLVIIGGMGSIPGVILGAAVLKGGPELLRALDEYRFLMFGALLVIMMIVRPEGIWPPQRKRMEFREAEGSGPVGQPQPVPGDDS
jgi:ABC-type branched-subunit amino acid transport system permease subunit